MNLLTLGLFNGLAGAFLLLVAGGIAREAGHPRRWGSALFWGLFGGLFLFGQALPETVVGYLVLALVALAACGRVAPSRAPGASALARAASAARLGNRIFLPALLIPATAVLGTVVLRRVGGHGWRLLDPDPSTTTILSVCLGAVVAAGLGVRITRDRPSRPVSEGSRLLQTVGWALLLPQLLAALGGVFARAGVGTVVAGLASRVLPTHSPLAAVIAYCLGMAGFTVCMGNAFAAFPVMTLGIGLPFIVNAHHGNPAIMAAIGMLCGYCGTLVTPMAANFNLVPAMLLELTDRNAVIRAQIPVALVILAANIALMALCVYRF